MTHRHSRTGIVYNVTPRAASVIVDKIVGNRCIEKRVNIRIEHVGHSKCRKEFLDRVKRNPAASAEAKKSGRALVPVHLFRSTLPIRWFRARRPQVGAVLPHTGHTVSTEKNAPQPIVPVRYETTIWYLYQYCIVVPGALEGPASLPLVLNCRLEG